MMDDEGRMLLDAAVLGKQVEDFFSSDVGRYLLAKADREYQRGIDALKRVNPADTAAVVTAQATVWRGESVRQWLEEAILAGAKATYILEEREENG